MKTRFTALLALLLFAAIATSRLEADSGTAATGAIDASSATNPPPSSATAAASPMKNILLKMAHRLVEVQQKTPDDKIKALITQGRLDDTAYLNTLAPDQCRKTVIAVAIGLYQASSTDPLAVQLMKEFQITYTPKAPAQPVTNAPPATQAIGT